jgi:quercetin dioxygenase-like cupin family protein
MSSDGTPASKFLATSEMPWRAFDEAPGVSFRVLKTHPPGRGATLLLRFDAGSAYPAHRHPEGEEYYVLDGELVDGARRYAAGTYVWHPPGSVHAPRSDAGAVVLVFVPGGIELVGPR